MTAREVKRRLRELGCREVRQRGSHVRFVSSCGRCFTTVPDHGSRDIPYGTLRAIEKDMEPCLGPKWLLK
jgi:predicted RNA binding protein YcfA (HicA-like mRNA interferase family)